MKIQLELEETDINILLLLLEEGIKKGKLPVTITDEKGGVLLSSNIAKECLRIDEEVSKQFSEQIKNKDIGS